MAVQSEAEWIDIRDEDGVLWRFDVHWLMSNWSCVYGRGCKGAHGVPDVGCCTIGAHFIDDDDIDRVEEIVKQLDPAEFTHGELIFKFGGSTESWLIPQVYETGTRWQALKKRVLWWRNTEAHDFKTIVVDDACVFMNGPEHINGAGCGLHQAAMNRGLPYQKFKPFVCSWAPMFSIEDAVCHETDEYEDIRYITKFRNKWWSEEGYEFNDWWCIDDPATFVGEQRVYQSMAVEIAMYCGQKVYDDLKFELDARESITPVTIGRPPAGSDGVAQRIKDEQK